MAVNALSGAVLLRYPQLLRPTEGSASWSQERLRAFLSYTLSVDRKRTFNDQSVRFPFLKQHLGVSSCRSSNPHAFEAGTRSQAREFCLNLARETGLTPYFVSSSRSEAARGYARERLFYDSKDLDHDPAFDPVPPDPLFVLIDVDFHCSREKLSYYLSRGPVIMYTYTLDALHTALPSSQHTFSRGTLRSIVDGGAVYEHPLWDWRTDHVLINGPWFSTIYAKVDHRGVRQPNRSLVLLSPSAVFGFASNFLVRAMFDVKPLKQFSVPKFNFDTVKGHGFVETLVAGDKTSMLLNGRLHRVVPNEIFNDLCAASRTSAAFSIATVQRALTTDGVKPDDVPKYALREAFKAIAPYEGLIDPTPRPRHYTPVFLDIEEEPKQRGTQICHPVIDRGIVPTEGPASDEACVVNRVEAIRPVEEKLPAEYYQFSREFRERAFPTNLVPETWEDFLDSLDGAELRKYANAAEGDPLEAVIRKTFQKVEAYPEPKAPRDIKDVPKPLVAEYSLFVRPLVAYIKANHAWYAFGRDPASLAQMVNDVCSPHKVIYPTDYSKFDGTQGEFLFNEWKADVIHAFHWAYTQRIDEIINAHHHKLHRSKYGRLFAILFQMLSGGADTSIRNTIHNARSCYIALRRSGLDADAAWRLLGLYGGDDGLTHFPSLEIAKETMCMLGLSIKISVKTEEDHIDFLGRIYPDPFTSIGSHHDITRAAGKLHISPHEISNDTPETMVWRKAVSIWVTDSSTPVLGLWAANVLRIVGAGTWRGTWQDRVMDWPLESGVKYSSRSIMERWPEPIYPAPTARQNIEALSEFLEQHDISLDRWAAWVSKLNNARSLSEFPSALATIEHLDSSECVLVDGQMIGPEPKNRTVAVCADHLGQGCRVNKCPDHHPESFCFAFLKGKCTRKTCKFPHITIRSRVDSKLVKSRPRPVGQ
nr:RNA-dependent RNA polymerase [Mute swan feces associated noda-like virus 3]